jgi:hypothetical protein
MPLVALIAALRGGPTAGRVCAAIGSGVIAGTVIQPVTRSQASLLNHIVMISNLGSGAVLLREDCAQVSLGHPETRTTESSGLDTDHQYTLNPSSNDYEASGVATTKNTAATTNKTAWSEFGYARPSNGNENRVVEIAKT